MMPLVSVAIPVFTVQDYVADALRSVFGQIFVDFEVVAVDDGSMDGSQTIVATFTNAWARLLLSSAETRRALVQWRQSYC